MTSARHRRPAVEALPTRAMLIVLLAGASLAFSMAFACATPFPALAAIAVVCVTPRDAFAAVTLAWLVNQADGFLFMGYPRTWDTFAWGVAIWAGAVAAAFAASAVSQRVVRRPLAASLVAFAVAFAAYEGVMFAVRLMLPSSPAAFSPAIVAYLLEVNAAAAAVLLLSVGLLKATGAASAPRIASTRPNVAEVELRRR